MDGPDSTDDRGWKRRKSQARREESKAGVRPGMIFPDSWKQRAIDKEQRNRSGQTTMRISRITLDLLKKLRGPVEASDDETIYYLAAAQLSTPRIQQTSTRPANASDAETRRLPSEKAGS